MSALKLFEGQPFPPFPVLDFGSRLLLVDFKTRLNPQLASNTFFYTIENNWIFWKSEIKSEIEECVFFQLWNYISLLMKNICTKRLSCMICYCCKYKVTNDQFPLLTSGFLCWIFHEACVNCQDECVTCGEVRGAIIIHRK